MLILLLPLAGVAGLWKWAGGKACFYKKECGLLSGSFRFDSGRPSDRTGGKRDSLWKCGMEEFFRLFNARTEVYDFKTADILKYEENKEFYDSSGLTEEEAALLGNYNYGVDDRIDAG